MIEPHFSTLLEVPVKFKSRFAKEFVRNLSPFFSIYFGADDFCQKFPLFFGPKRGFFDFDFVTNDALNLVFDEEDGFAWEQSRKIRVMLVSEL